ncbi:eukaryotic translation initiation factor 2D [Lycorma delicatula]|uniref:eukaryotic translation initiation factor 2D n=1 Tax=Lycorma delicatula TaxID=130591 RepID=UPI003F510AEC
MFKKPFRVKSNSRLKGSDTKKLKAEILKHFPSLCEESLSVFMPNKETIFSVKIIAHSGEVVLLYCVQKLPIIFELDGHIYPTVYMLWQFPSLLPTFTTHPQVFTAISGGADLMLPGVVFSEEVSIKSYGKLNKGDRVSVNLTCNKAPIAVGKAALSSYDMYMSAKRGKCVNILHFYGDTLSNYGSTLLIPELGPVCYGDHIEEDGITPDENTEDPNTLIEIASNLVLVENTDNFLTLVECAVDQDPPETVKKDHDINTCELNENIEDTSDKEDSSENLKEIMNELLMYCFLKSLKTSVKKSTFPLLVSTFYRQHILAACPPGKNVDIKKTKYKKLSNFLNEVEKTGIIKLEMLSKGVQSISFVAFDHSLIKEFDSRFFDLANSDKEELVMSNKPIVPEVTEKRTVTAAVLPLFSIYLNKKGDSLTMQSIRKCITDYVKSQNLKFKENEKFVKLDKVLKDIIGSTEDILTWDALINGVINKMGHSYELIAGEKKTTVVKGKLQPIDIQVGTRVGNKKVTLVSNLELYGINVSEFAHECQHGVGASTTINNVPGSKSAQVQIQGNQVIFVNKLLTEKYSIQKRFIRGLENAPKKKK